MSCRVKYNIWQDTYQKRCTLFAALIDGVTSKVIVAVRDEQVTSELGDPEWDDLINKLTESIPPDTSDLEVKYSDGMKKYMEEAEKKAIIEEERGWVDRATRETPKQ